MIMNKHFFSFLFLSSVPWQCFPLLLSFISLIHSSTSFILLLIPSRVLFIYYIVHLCSLKLLSLFSISCIFSVCTSILFLRSWITFSIVFTLNSFSVDCLYPLHLVVLTGIYLVPSSVTSLCHLLLSNFLCLWSLLLRLQDCNSSWFWCLLPDGLGWSRGLCRLSVMMHRCLPTGGWSWVFSYWWTELCQRVCL